jgi:ankyrin repeat protein
VWGKPDVVKLLLDKGANIDARDSQGHTALWWAVDGNKADLVNLLQARGAH